jgi:hypothetical protein
MTDPGTSKIIPRYWNKLYVMATFPDNNIVAYLLKARRVESGETSIAGEQHGYTLSGVFYAVRATFP